MVEALPVEHFRQQASHMTHQQHLQMGLRKGMAILIYYVVENTHYQAVLIAEASFFFFWLYAAWVRSRAERPSVSYTKVVMVLCFALIAIGTSWDVTMSLPSSFTRST